MSTIEVNKLIPQSGTSVQIGENGDTITIPAGATFDASAGTITLADGSVTTAKIADGAVSLVKLSATGTKDNTTFLRGDNTFQVVNTDLVSDTSPQLGGTLDGNGNTINLSANNVSMRIPSGTAAQQPSAEIGGLRFDTTKGVLTYSDGSDWYKIASQVPSLSSVSGSIIVSTATNLTLAGTGFLTSNLVVNFLQATDSINANVTVTPTSDTAATVAVPSAVYSNVTGGNAVTIKVTNSDNLASGTINKTAVALPSGGSISTSGTERIHTFTSSGTFVNTIANLSVQFLVVAGGGSGGNDNLTGGGGAGGYRTSYSGGSNVSGGNSSLESALSLSAANHTVTVGAGGTSYSNGVDSTISSITSIGGGRGARNAAAGNGGSGGGQYTTVGSIGTGTSGQGNNGGAGISYQENSGGGGGASQVGGTAQNSNGGAGGNGLTNTISGSSTVYAGGGGGGVYSSTGGTGGTGGGGAAPSQTGKGADGTANTGGGGGGGSYFSQGWSGGSNGGSGIVILRYDTAGIQEDIIWHIMQKYQMVK